MTTTINADNGVSSGSAGLKSSADNSGVLQLQTNGTAALTVDTSQNVGIGTASPAAKLEVSGAVTRLTSTNPNLQINSTASPGYKSNINFLQSGTAKYEIGVDIGNSGNNNLYFYDNVASLERMRIDSSGNLLVGLTSQISSAKVSISGGGGGGGLSPLALVNPSQPTRTWNCGPDSGGNFGVTTVAGVNGQYIAYGATVWSSTSDERLKTPLIPFENAIDKVCTLRAGTGRYLKDDESVSRVFLIAQDVQAVLPEAVNVQDDEIGTLGLAYTDVIPLLVAAIKEQQALIQSLTTRITALEAK